MRALSFITALALALALAVPGEAHAQSAGAAGELQNSTKTTPAQKRAYAESSLTEMQAAQAEIAGMLEKAEREGDSLQVKCLSSKLATVTALIEAAEGAAAKMDAELNATDPQAAGRAETEFRKIAVAASKVRQFQAESYACNAEGGAGDGSQRQVDNTLVSGDESADTQTDDDASTDVGTDAFTTSPFE